MKGPEATAGSTFKRCIISGIKAPAIVATVKVAKI
jgi:hypothetical protein